MNIPTGNDERPPAIHGEPFHQETSDLDATRSEDDSTASDVDYAAGDPYADLPHPAEVSSSGQQTETQAAHDELPKLWRATDLKRAEQPQWLARSRIPRAAISLLVGDEGIGKSLFWTWLAGHVTNGTASDDFGIPARAPQDVLVIVTEDDWSTTVRPRLEIVGADLNRITVVCADEDGSGAPVFPRDMHVLTASTIRPALIVVDAWLDTVTGTLSVKDPQQARRALHPWKELAQTKNSAVLLLSHTNRTTSGNPRDKYGATGELRKKARMTLFAQADPDNEGHLLIGPEKANSAGKVDATRFQITASNYFAPTSDDDGCIPQLTPLGDSGQTMRKHLADAHAEATGEDGEDEKGYAVKWLREYLELEGPEVRSADVKREARNAGIPERTLARARKDLNVNVGYYGAPPITKWSLPVTPLRKSA